ncbi:hypothetical protein [Methanococcoides sp. AM1]|uniref:hypothetical protein n=1 Tax=Methanococcoides sp. AM1 TaxID=1201011 RepID=UPI001082B6E0|nr:hypothetical protein [Methanococcoides sp. AM1]
MSTDIVAQAAAYREQHIAQLVEAHTARIKAEVHADIVEGKLTPEEWDQMPIEERMARYFYKGESK